MPYVRQGRLMMPSEIWAVRGHMVEFRVLQLAQCRLYSSTPVSAAGLHQCEGCEIMLPEQSNITCTSDPVLIPWTGDEPRSYLCMYPRLLAHKYLAALSRSAYTTTPSRLASMHVPSPSFLISPRS